MADPACRLVAGVLVRKFETSARSHRSHHRKLVARSPVGVLHLLHHLADRVASQRNPSQRSQLVVEPGELRAQQDRHLFRRRHREQGGGGKAEGSRFGSSQPKRKQLGRRFERGAMTVDDGPPIRSEPGRAHHARLERDLTDVSGPRPLQRPPDGQSARHGHRSCGDRREGDQGDPEPARSLAGRSSRGRQLQRLQRECEITGRLEALRRVLLEAAPHQPVQVARDLLGQRGRLGADDRPADLERGRTLEGPPARQHLVEHHARGEEVGTVVGARSAHLLRRPKPRSSIARGRCSPAPASSALGAAAGRAMPKSRIFSLPSCVMNRFSGLMSRWTSPFSCAAESPRASCTPYSSALRNGSARPASRRRNVSPSSSSETTYGPDSSWPMSCTMRMFGSASAPAVRASCSRRRSSSASRTPDASTLTATSRSSSRSRAANTRPIPPWPSSFPRRYRPARTRADALPSPARGAAEGNGDAGERSASSGGPGSLSVGLFTLLPAVS